RAVQLFLTMAKCEHPKLLGSTHFGNFLSYAIWTHYGDVEDLLHKMLLSDSENAVQNAAQLFFVAARNEPRAAEICASFSTASFAVRKGLAKVAAARIGLWEDRARCEEELSKLFNDPDRAIRQIAATCFHDLSAEHFESATTFIETFITSRAFEEHAFFFFDRLKEVPVHLPDIVCKAFERSAALAQGRGGKAELDSGHFASRTSTVLVRLYERTDSTEVKRQCLDIIDSLAKSPSIYDLESVLQGH
ncbi:MAG TPA: hypothetical protein VK171_03520, partial [Fimbriimonas sp.]|nr:hypothetical protein [Fimbriimonas sp.]